MQFWKQYCDSIGIDHAKHNYNDAWAFGDNPKLADELVNLVKKGLKTTTTGAVLENKLNNWEIEKDGDIVIILDGNGDPSAIIQYTEVKIMKMSEMRDLQFALDEGEGFDTIDKWRDVHLIYYNRVMKQFGKEAIDDMEIICSRFNCIYPK